MFSKTLKTSLAVVLFGIACNAQAASLGFTLLDVPDIASFNIDVAYDAGTDTLTATGFALTIDYSETDPAENITDGSFSVVATIDSTGAISGGTVTITGTVPVLGFNSGTLLTGDLTDFGFPDAGGDPLEFLFDVTGGDAAALYGDKGGIKLIAFAPAGGGFTGDWTTDWDNLGPFGFGTGEADTAAVPVPAPLLLLLSALIGVGVSSRRR